MAKDCGRCETCLNELGQSLTRCFDLLALHAAVLLPNWAVRFTCEMSSDTQACMRTRTQGMGLKNKRTAGAGDKRVHSNYEREGRSNHHVYEGPQGDKLVTDGGTQ